MPPQMIGGHVSGPMLVSRSEALFVAVRQILAYPIGFEVEIEAHARGAAPGGPPPDPSVFTGHSELRFRLRLADGRDVLLDDETGLHSGRGPMMVLGDSSTSSGGPNDSESVRLTLWVWTLPPPGLLTLECSWPRRGLHDAGLVLDADAIRAAAALAQPYWPERL
jgi:hypothetical protein